MRSPGRRAGAAEGESIAWDTETRIVRSSPPLTITAPPVLVRSTDSARIGPVWPVSGSPIGSPFSGSQTRRISSSPALTRTGPSGACHTQTAISQFSCSAGSSNLSPSAGFPIRTDQAVPDGGKAYRSVDRRERRKSAYRTRPRPASRSPPGLRCPNPRTGSSRPRPLRRAGAFRTRRSAPAPVPAAYGRGAMALARAFPRSSTAGSSRHHQRSPGMPSRGYPGTKPSRARGRDDGASARLLVRRCARPTREACRRAPQRWRAGSGSAVSAVAATCSLSPVGSPRPAAVAPPTSQIRIVRSVPALATSDRPRASSKETTDATAPM